ncbi:integrase [Limnohabitans sp. TS-CS-82]|uniref:tyrosine-type recombinase/integrase n=1 Tax=Limnohabitans sp. TS-CS-82 TaxID=2094193 RepID=UPI000CF1FE71|nr:site-specific integrase [Limnohabitans sp. TS-CS-82]PQA80202.1 integrase [Limnohabitans sp. TS-CS-82]
MKKKSTDSRTLNGLDKPQRYSIPGERGMLLWVRPDLKKYWVLRFSLHGRRYDYSMGSFPTVTLAAAKEKALKARAMIMDGVNPIEARTQASKEAKRKVQHSITFRRFSDEYIESISPEWSGPRQYERWVNSIATYALPTIGHMTLEEITTDDIVEILTPIWITKNETASKLRARLQRIFSAAITRGLRTKANPADLKNHLENILPSVRRDVKHHEALPYQEMPAFMSYLRHKSSVGSLALQFTLLNVCRTGETLYAKRTEIVDDLWTIPKFRMKMRKEHQVPLCSRSLEILEEAKLFDPDSEYLFSISGQPLSNMTMLMLCRRYKSGLTTHGTARATFRTWVSDETEFSPELAEAALAHQAGDAVVLAYNRAKMVQRRRLLMNQWQVFCLGETSQKDLVETQSSEN